MTPSKKKANQLRNKKSVNNVASFKLAKELFDKRRERKNKHQETQEICKQEDGNNKVPEQETIDQETIELSKKPRQNNGEVNETPKKSYQCLGKAGRKRNYSDQQKAEALAILKLNGGNVLRTSKITGVPRTTLEYWTSGGGIYEAVTNLREVKSNDLGEIMEDVAWSLAASMPDKIPYATLKDTATSYGIMFDKIMLHKGKPTVITATQEMNDEQLMERLRSIAGRVSQRLALPGPTGETGSTIHNNGDRIPEVTG